MPQAANSALVLSVCSDNVNRVIFMYPNWKQGLKVALVAGGVAAVAYFGYCVWVSNHPAVTQHGLASVFRPWWRWGNWRIAGIIFLFAGSFFGLLTALRPDLRKKNPTPPCLEAADQARSAS
jgi:hypothetical protein